MSIIRDILNECNINELKMETMKDLLKQYKEIREFESNVTDKKVKLERLYHLHSILMKRGMDCTISYKEFVNAPSWVEFGIDNDGNYCVSRICIVIQDKLTMLREAKYYTNKYEITDQETINSIVKLNSSIRDTLDELNKYLSMNLKEQIELIDKEVKEVKEMISSEEFEKQCLDKYDFLKTLNNKKKDKRLYDLYYEYDHYEGLFWGSAISIMEFVEMIFDNIDTY